jgi:hypothetical protein
VKNASLTPLKRVLLFIVRTGVEFIWDSHNLKHLAKHGLTQELAETILMTGIQDATETTMRHLCMIETAVDGRAYRMIFDMSRDAAIYTVTAFPL